VKNSVYLFSVKLGKLLLGHVVDEEIVSYLGISVYALTVSLCDSLRKNSGVLRVEQEINPSQLAVFFGAVPVTSKKFSIGVICVD